MCKFSSKSGGVPFQISFFWGDLTRNDPMAKFGDPYNDLSYIISNVILL